MKRHLVTILILLTANAWCARSTQAQGESVPSDTAETLPDPLLGKRADWLRGSWGLNWKPVNLYNGRSESLTIDDFLDQISGLKTIDYLQLHLGDSHKNSCVHLGTHDLLESLWQGDTNARGNPINLVVPRKSAGEDPFLKMLKATKAAGLKTQLYVNSANMLAFTGQNPSAFPNITERWKAWCDTNPEAQAFIASQPYHTHARYPNRKYMFCYAEFVLKDYSIRYGDLVDGWLFDAGHQFIGRNGDNPTSGKAEDQRLYRAFALACRAGNPNTAVCFNNGPERDTEELNPFSEATRYDDYMFGHPYAPRVSLGDHASRTYERNYAHIQKITETGGNVHAGGAWTWDDKVVGHFDPPMSSTRWNTGSTPGLTDEEFLLWNLESARGGGAISWGAPLVRPEGAGDELLIQDWGMAQLALMDEHLSIHQAPGAPNWSRAETYLPDATMSQAYSRTLVEGVDFWDPEGENVTLSLVDAPTWLSLKQDTAQPGHWLLQGMPTETSETEHKFRLRAEDATGATDRWVELKVGALAM
ncbi:hypothetical protein Q31b_17360 [Novipirellula aureliae]|uniref:Uncharacterized protein n=1 Tax=Novipirellula aureliae TaxID=2527966 RepID=A0A5C6E5U7_9BACT|nr:hypothetical protein [Novipirellula aureliae]TWU44200.1 hypothetical protein Q31b_17360 [Novipirellula aureliae]